MTPTSSNRLDPILRRPNQDEDGEMRFLKNLFFNLIEFIYDLTITALFDILQKLQDVKTSERSGMKFSILY